MEGRIGSTRPMPMNDTTQAKATAKTAFGCLNGLAAPVDAPLIPMLRFGMYEAPEIDQADAHERHDAGEGDREDRLRLLERAGRSGGCATHPNAPFRNV